MQREGTRCPMCATQLGLGIGLSSYAASVRDRVIELGLGLGLGLDVKRPTCAADGPFAPPGAATTESRRVRNEARERSRRSAYPLRCTVRSGCTRERDGGRPRAACNWLSRAHTSLVRSKTSASARRRAVCSAPSSARSFSTCCGRKAIDLPRCLKAASKNRICRLIDSTHAARSYGI